MKKRICEAAWKVRPLPMRSSWSIREAKDQTLSIAREFTDQVFQEPWKGFAQQKNSAQDKARGPWILNIDADERVTPELKEEILRVIHNELFLAGYKIPRKNFFCGQWIRHGGWYPNYQLRLYQKDAGAIQPSRGS